MSELIKREDVRREIQAMFDGGAFSWQEGQNLMDRINALPTASPWHRCEDELPPDGTIGRYLAYVFTNDAHWELHIVAWFRNKWLFNCGRVHYWMPIEPPKEDA